MVVEMYVFVARVASKQAAFALQGVVLCTYPPCALEVRKVQYKNASLSLSQLQGLFPGGTSLVPISRTNRLYR